MNRILRKYCDRNLIGAFTTIFNFSRMFDSMSVSLARSRQSERSIIYQHD